MSIQLGTGRDRRLSVSHWEMDRSVELCELTVGALLNHAAAQAPDTEALVEGVTDPAARRRWTFGELHRDAHRAAQMLLRTHRPGERVAIWAPNIPEWAIFQFGAALAGLTLVTVNPAYTARELSYVLAQSRAAGLAMVPTFRGTDLVAMLDSVRGDLPELREVLDLSTWTPADPDGVPQADLPTVTLDDPAMILYTSGTTGFAKGAVLTHRGVVNNPKMMQRRWGIDGGTAWVNPLPMYHVGGSVMCSIGSLLARSAHVLVPAFEPESTLRVVESERAAMLTAVPTMLIAMLERPTFADTDLSALKVIVSGGTTVPPELIVRVEREFGARFSMTFGQTETCGCIAQSDPDDSPQDKSETVGRPMEQIEARIADVGTGETLPPNAVGEVWARGFGVMRGYFEMPEQTAQTIDADGWLHTGDLGSMDERGFLRITGRVKDMVIRGGENLYPREIEDVLSAHPDVAEIAVIGVPDDYWGEELAAFVRPTPGAAADPAALRQAAARVLAKKKVPKYWRFVDVLPTTPSGKVQKFVLRETFLKTRDGVAG